MPLSDEQKKRLNHALAMMEQSATKYGEVRVIYKHPYWRHIQVVTAEDMPVPGYQSDQGKGEEKLRQI